MRTKNLISVFQGAYALEAKHSAETKELKNLKPHEIRNLEKLCSVLKSGGCGISDLDGYFVGYTIPQISKEFDLLRFGEESVINIEIKSELKVANKIDKILRQMRKNYYYLKYLQIKIYIFEYIDNDGLYKYDIEKDSCIKCDYNELISYIKSQKPILSLDLDALFLPSRFLISPFNSTKEFIDGDYFLTPHQERIKEEILSELKTYSTLFFTISANAGTGKTLLLYDIAKTFIFNGKKVKIIHCGKLNQGHQMLIRDYNWDVISVGTLPRSYPLPSNESYKDYDIIFVDESQRIRLPQLDYLTTLSEEYGIPIVFSFDVKQYLRDGESLDLTEYLTKNYSSVICSSKKLTNRIRTNKAMASFITNLIDIGKSKDNLDYSCVSIDYMNDSKSFSDYLAYLKMLGWKIITFTPSLKDETSDPYYFLSRFSDTNAHDVIGQEFPKVVLLMDKNFVYIGGKLKGSSSYYNSNGMLYQIVTRVVNELKIVVYDNPELYFNLLKIKGMSEIE